MFGEKRHPVQNMLLVTDLEPALKKFEAFGEIAPEEQEQRFAEACFGKPRSQGERLVVTPQGIIQSALSSEFHPQAVVRPGKIGVDLERPIEIPDCLVRSILSLRNLS